MGKEWNGQISTKWKRVRVSNAVKILNMVQAYMLSFQLCPTLRDPMDCSPAGSSVYGILQARILEWGAISFSSLPRHQIQVSWIAGGCFTIWVTREVHSNKNDT